MTDLARALLDEIAADPAAIERLADLLVERVAARLPARQESGPALMTLVAAAKQLGCHPKTIRRRIDDGSLPAVVDHGRPMIRADDLRAYVERLDREAGAPARRRARPRRDYGFLLDRTGRS